MRCPVPMRFPMARAGRISSNRRADPRLRMLQFPVNSKLNSAHRKQRKPGFRLSGLNQVSEPELPFPDPGYLGSGNAVFDAFVNHGIPPSNSDGSTPREQRCSMQNAYFSRKWISGILSRHRCPHRQRADIGSDGPFIWLRSLSNRRLSPKRPSVRPTELCSCPENYGDPVRRNFVHGRRTTGDARQSGKFGNFRGNVRNGPRGRALSACSVRSRSSSLSGPAFSQETPRPFLFAARVLRGLRLPGLRVAYGAGPARAEWSYGSSPRTLPVAGWTKCRRVQAGQLTAS